MENNNIERRIVIGMVVSTDFLLKIKDTYQQKFIQSATAKTLAEWCFTYFKKYQKAPGKDIEAIFYKKAKRLPKETVSDLEELIFELSEEYVDSEINFDALSDDTQEYFTERQLFTHAEEIKALLEGGDVDTAKQVSSEFKAVTIEEDPSIDFDNPKTLPIVEKSLNDVKEPLFKLPKQLGEFMNHQLIPGGFIAFLAPEKRGKSFLLMNLAITAVRQGVSVAFFQAGDMTTPQQLRRMCIRVARRSDLEKYCDQHYQPVRDCIHNQRDTCDKKVRECNYGVFPTLSVQQLREEITKDQLIEAFRENRDYKPCWNCSEYQQNHWGAVWLEKVPTTSPLTASEASKVFDQFFVKGKKRIRLSTHSSGTLSVTKVINILNKWDKEEGFRPQLILFDYVDIMAADSKMEFRHQENEKWKGLRRVSQLPWEPLVGTVTQSDADSYERKTLNLKNFSEDKRKYGHVTAFYGLNQDPGGREKEIGIMRINELLVREGEPNARNQVYLLQNLKRGLAYNQSFL